MCKNLSYLFFVIVLTCSCEIGDNVLVYYEKTVENFIVFTLTGNLHYIHTDSIKDCDFGKGKFCFYFKSNYSFFLFLDVQSNEFQWIIAKVLDKEYCQIKKVIALFT